MKWSIDFCLQSRVYTETHHKNLLELLQQELKIAAELDPSYSNPFSESEQIRLARKRRDEEQKQGRRTKTKRISKNDDNDTDADIDEQRQVVKKTAGKAKKNKSQQITQHPKTTARKSDEDAIQHADL